MALFDRMLLHVSAPDSPGGGYGPNNQTDAFLHSKIAAGVAGASSDASHGHSGEAFAPRVTQLTITMTGDLTGAFSDLAYDGDGVYWSITDDAGAGPDRVINLIKLKITPEKAEILEAIPLKDELGNLVKGPALDPEAVTVAPDGSLWLSDEVGPYILHVSREGQILQRVNPPTKYRARQNGRGFEGLTISPDGTTLYAILQTGLTTEVDKSHTWIVAYDIASGAFKEYKYYLDKPSAYNYPAGFKPFIGANSLKMVAPSELLVLERDNQSGANARQKRVYWVTIPAEPTDQPLEKRLVVDLYALGYVMEKVESVEVPHPNTMLVMNDNDGDTELPTVVWYMQW